jgi:hypothetical protein
MTFGHLLRRYWPDVPRGRTAVAVTAGTWGEIADAPHAVSQRGASFRRSGRSNGGKAVLALRLYFFWLPSAFQNAKRSSIENHD